MGSAAATELARRLAALPEPQMRQRVLLELIHDWDATEASAMLAEVQQLGYAGGPPFSIALGALVSLLASGALSYGHQQALYEAAKSGGHEGLARLFLSADTTESGGSQRREEDRELTLGHRKSLARSGDREVLERLLRDPEPPVIRNLLLNTHVTESDIVRLAARRPTDPDVQREICSCARWISRYAVRRALVLNPYTPTDISIRLLSFLRAPDLRLVRTSPTLPTSLREAAHARQAESR